MVLTTSASGSADEGKLGSTPSGYDGVGYRPGSPPPSGPPKEWPDATIAYLHRWRY